MIHYGIIGVLVLNIALIVLLLSYLCTMVQYAVDIYQRIRYHQPIYVRDVMFLVSNVLKIICLFFFSRMLHQINVDILNLV